VKKWYDPYWVARIILYYKNGLIQNRRNKKIYFVHQAKVEALEHSVFRMHEHIYGVLTDQEARVEAEKEVLSRGESGDGDSVDQTEQCKHLGGRGSTLDEIIEKYVHKQSAHQLRCIHLF